MNGRCQGFYCAAAVSRLFTQGGAAARAPVAERASRS